MITSMFTLEFIGQVSGSILMAETAIGIMVSIARKNELTGQLFASFGFLSLAVCAVYTY